MVTSSVPPAASGSAQFLMAYISTRRKTVTSRTMLNRTCSASVRRALACRQSLMALRAAEYQTERRAERAKKAADKAKKALARARADFYEAKRALDKAKKRAHVTMQRFNEATDAHDLAKEAVAARGSGYTRP
jgi:hypothetical protein